MSQFPPSYPFMSQPTVPTPTVMTGANPSVPQPVVPRPPQQRYQPAGNQQGTPRLILLTFSRPDCPYCQKQTPILQQIAQAFAGIVQLETRDVYQNRELASAWGVTAAPTHFITKPVPNDQPAQVLARMNGMHEFSMIKQALEQALQQS